MREVKFEAHTNPNTGVAKLMCDMDGFKAARRRLSSLTEINFNMYALKSVISRERIPKESLSERMVRHYSLESEDDIEETRSNIRVSNIFGRRRSSSGSNKSNRFKNLSKHLSAEETEINKERLAAVGDLMSVFYDDEDDVSSDQDDLIEELQDIGYIITPKGISTKSVLSNCHCKTRTAGKTGHTTEHIHKTSFQSPLPYNRMVHERKQYSQSWWLSH